MIKVGDWVVAVDMDGTGNILAHFPVVYLVTEIMDSPFSMAKLARLDGLRPDTFGGYPCAGTLKADRFITIEQYNEQHQRQEG